MTTAVLDTNVLASGFTHRGGVPDQLLRLWLDGSFELIISDHIFTELARTFQKPYFLDRLGSGQVRQNLDLLRSRATLTPITVVVTGVATHPEDDLILATAISAKADYLVTGDHKLGALGSYERVNILTPRAFGDVLAFRAQD